MKDLDDFDRQIEERLAAQKEHAVLTHNHLVERMHEYDERHRRFTALADHVIQDIIRPRMERLVRRFDNAKLLPTDESGRHTCICSFAHTARYPANVKLELGVSRDGDFEHVYLLYNLCITPIYFKFDGQEQMAMPLDAADERRVAEWVDNRILTFVDTYFRLETTEQYQADNYVTDPVCHMRINRLFAPEKTEYAGQTYFFCVPACKAKFVADPDKYLVGQAEA
jgi:YHS domain-containing protein